MWTAKSRYQTARGRPGPYGRCCRPPRWKSPDRPIRRRTMATTDATPNPGTLQEAQDQSSYRQSSRICYSASSSTNSASALKRSPTNARLTGRATYKPRRLKTRVGSLEPLIPQDRDGRFRTELFEKYQRNEKVLVLSLMELYLQGVSTRRVRDVTEALCPASLSKSTVSDLTQTRSSNEASHDLSLSGCGSRGVALSSTGGRVPLAHGRRSLRAGPSGSRGSQSWGADRYWRPGGRTA